MFSVFFSLVAFFSLVFAAPRQQQQQISYVLEVSTIMEHTWSSVSWFPSFFLLSMGFWTSVGFGSRLGDSSECSRLVARLGDLTESVVYS